MLRNGWKLALVALALSTASAANAGDSEDFAGCDGLRKPKSKDDGMRSEAALTGWHNSALFGAPSSQPERTLASCNRALSNPKLRPTQTLRRAHLLRARAAAQLELGKPALALADLDAAQALVADRANDLFFARSMGASLLLLRANANAGLGNMAEAVALAGQAAELRPYALQVQLAASTIRAAAPHEAPLDLAEAHRLLRLEPRAASQLVLRAHQGGDFASVRRLAETLDWGNDGKAKSAGFIVQVDNVFLNMVTATLAAAYADAAAGDSAGARRRVEDVRARLAMLAAGAGASASITKVLSEKLADPRIAQVEARLALAKQGVQAALDRVVDARLPADAATVDLFQAIQAQAGEGQKTPDPASVAAELAKSNASDLGRIAPSLLIAPESARKLIDYKQSRPNILGALIGGALTMGTSLLGGIDRTTGFRSSSNADGTVTVEYVGNTNSGPMVQEMTLLRAAELARESGKAGFAIVERKDYQQFVALMRGGFEESRTPSGYKTELTIRLLDAAEPAAFDAVAVIDDLGPLYYES